MDGIFGIGPLELILIAVIALIVLGPERLPAVMREGARYIRELRKLGSELTSQFGDELKVLDEMNPRRLINEALNPKQDALAKPTLAATPAPDAKQPPAPKAPAILAIPAEPAPAPVSSAAIITRAAGGAPPAPSPAAGENGAGENGATPAAVDDETANRILPPAAEGTAVAAADSHHAPLPETPV